MPEKLNTNKIKNILIVKDGIAREEKFANVYTLKQAYETLVEYVKSLHLATSTEEKILSMGLNNYINPNLEYDLSKTALAVESSIKNITPTQGMVNKGDIIISKNDLVTPEVYKVLESFRIEHEQSLGSTVDRIRITAAQTILTLIAILSFSIFLYISRKRLFYNTKDFFFLYSMFLLTIAVGSISYFQNINILAIPVLFFPIIVNILFGTRPALYLLLGTTMLIGRHRGNVQPLPPATPVTTIHRASVDIRDLRARLRGIHAHTRRDVLTETLLRDTLVVNQHGIIKFDISRPIPRGKTFRVHLGNQFVGIFQPEPSRAT